MIRGIIAAGISFGLFIGFYHIDAEETFTIYTFSYVIPLFLIGIIYTGFLPLVFSWCRLAKRGSRDSEGSVITVEDDDLDLSVLTLSDAGNEENIYN